MHSSENCRALIGLPRRCIQRGFVTIKSKAFAWSDNKTTQKLKTLVVKMIKMLCEEFKNKGLQATRFKLRLLILAEISIRWLLAAKYNSPLNQCCSSRNYSFALALFLFDIPVQRVISSFGTYLYCIYLFFFCFFFTDVMKTVFIASAMWLLLTISMHFFLSPMAEYIAAIICGTLFLVIPIVNHVRILFAIRRHNNQLGDAVAAQQMAAVMRREKQVAVDMCVVAIFLSASLIPAMTMKFFEFYYPRVHSIVLPWSLTIAFLTSSINPVFYVIRNRNLRNAVKSLVNL